MYEPLPSPRQSHAQNDPKTLPGPRPSLSAASTLAPAEISCSTTAAWPFRAAQCSAVSPRAPRMRGGWRGSCRCRRETKCSQWDVSPGGWAKFCNIGHKYIIYIYIRSAKLILFVSFSVRHGEKQEEQSSQICSCSIVLFKSYNQLHLTFAISCVTCLKIIS